MQSSKPVDISWAARVMLVFIPALSSFVAVDGVMGSDGAKTDVMRIDAVNGIFSVEPSMRP